MKPQPKPKRVKLKRNSVAWKALQGKIDERDNLTCQLCRTDERLVVPQYHHVIFRSQGGGDTIDNLLTLCHSHHMVGIHGGGPDATKLRREAEKVMEEINEKDM